MARTKQVARKSTGGKAPRKQLSGKAASKTEAMKKMETKKKRYRPGELALKEIRKYQASSDFLMKMMPFQRVVEKSAKTSTRKLNGKERHYMLYKKQQKLTWLDYLKMLTCVRFMLKELQLCQKIFN